jgi:hypothetical protein
MIATTSVNHLKIGQSCRSTTLDGREFRMTRREPNRKVSGP